MADLAGINWVDVLINWFPMLLLIAVWLIFLGKFLGKKSAQGQTLDEFRRQNAILERIAVALEKRG